MDDFEYAQDDILRNLQKKLMVNKVHRIVTVLTQIRENHPKEVYQEYYKIYSVSIDVFYKK